jgi:hypothetical protein
LWPWEEIALPPPLDHPAKPPVPSSVAPELTASYAAADQGPSSSPVPPPARSRVRLGFADGTEVVLDGSSGASDALHAAARRIID